MSGGRTHIPKINSAACRTCGGCTWRCPAAVFTDLAAETDSLRGAIFTSRPQNGKTAQLSPCQLACPLGQDVPGYVAAIAGGDVSVAAERVRETNALPAVCGRLCIASCMRACVRAGIDSGVDIRGLKRFATHAVQNAPVEKSELPKDAVQVAIVGGGPAGLAAAHRLFQMGIKPVVFEARAVAGGMPVHVAPSFVMPSELIARDVSALVEQGIEIRCGVRVGKDVSWDDLAGDFAAVLVAVGAGEGCAPLNGGGDLKGVTTAVEFNLRVRKGSLKTLDGPVVVEGSGAAALLTARSARRLGAKIVQVVSPVPLELWSCGEDAVRFAEEEGVEIMPQQRVTEIEGSEGRIQGVRLQKVKVVSIDKVKRHALRGSASEQVIPAEIFVSTSRRRTSIGDRPDLEEMRYGRLGNLLVDNNYRTGRSKWYAAGEAATGMATVVDSMATGQLAAEAIARDLDADSRGE